MPKKRHKPEEIVAKLRQVDVLTSQGTTVADAICQIGVTEVTYYRRRNEYGDLKTDQVRRIKKLEQENARLRRAVSDLTLDKLILQGEAEKANGCELFARRMPSEIAKPFTSCWKHASVMTGVHQSLPADTPCFRAPGLPRARPAPFDTAQTIARA